MKYIFSISALFSVLIPGLPLNSQMALAQSSSVDGQDTEAAQTQTKGEKRREKRQHRRQGGAVGKRHMIVHWPGQVSMRG